MAQSRLWRAKTSLLVKDCTHILICWQGTLHKHISLAISYCKNSEICSLNVVLLVNNLENSAINIKIFANLLDNLLITKENWINKTLIICIIDSLDSVRVLSVSHCKALLTAYLSSLYDFL